MKLKGLREWRERRGLTQKELGRSSGVWAETISALERGEREARPSTARKLAEGLGIDVGQLLDVRREEGEQRYEEASIDYTSEFSGENPLFFELGRLLKEAERSGGPEAQMEVLELLIEQAPSGWRQELYRLYHAEQELRRGLRSEMGGLPRQTAAVIVAYARVLRSLVGGTGGGKPSRAALEDVRRALEAGRLSTGSDDAG